jgi:hypothetical protein
MKLSPDTCHWVMWNKSKTLSSLILITIWLQGLWNWQYKCAINININIPLSLYLLVKVSHAMAEFWPSSKWNDNTFLLKSVRYDYLRSLPNATFMLTISASSTFQHINRNMALVNTSTWILTALLYPLHNLRHHSAPASPKFGVDSGSCILHWSLYVTEMNLFKLYKTLV